MSIEDMDETTFKVQQIIAQAKEEIKSTTVDKDVDLDLDLGNLTAVDINSLEESSLKSSENRDGYLREVGREGIQLLINKIWELPTCRLDNNTYAKLPKPSTLLPREKPVPKPKAPTKWELYAKEKGIKKRKREWKVYDEIAEDFVPRYGKLRVQLEKDKNWVIEVPQDADPYEDQFAKAASAKKERIAKNEYQRLRNIARAQKEVMPGVGVTRTDTRDISQLKKAMHFAKFATASLGKFQPKLRGEKEIRGFANKNNETDKPFVGVVRDEKKRSLKIIEKIRHPIVNTEAAVIKQVERNMTMIEEADAKEARKQVRRSKMGGRKNAKSGAAIAQLTDGKLGDKKSRKLHALEKAKANMGGGGGKQHKLRKKDKLFHKSAFGGAFGKKVMLTAAGKKKHVSNRRRRS